MPALSTLSNACARVTLLKVQVCTPNFQLAVTLAADGPLVLSVVAAVESVAVALPEPLPQPEKAAANKSKKEKLTIVFIAIVLSIIG